MYAIDERYENRGNAAVMDEGQAFDDRIALYHYVVKCESSRVWPGRRSDVHCWLLSAES